jgi:hypothetical protein
MTPSLSSMTPTLSNLTPFLSQMNHLKPQITGPRLREDDITSRIFCHELTPMDTDFQRVKKKLTTEDAEDTDFGLVYLIFNFGYYSMC